MGALGPQIADESDMMRLTHISRDDTQHGGAVFLGQLAISSCIIAAMLVVATQSFLGW